MQHYSFNIWTPGARAAQHLGVHVLSLIKLRYAYAVQDTDIKEGSCINIKITPTSASI